MVENGKLKSDNNNKERNGNWMVKVGNEERIRKVKEKEEYTQ